MQKNIKLKVAIFESGKTSKQVAIEAGISPSFLSMATTGRYIMDRNQKRNIAKVLGKDTQDLFN
jgi:hypothetical protein